MGWDFAVHGDLVFPDEASKKRWSERTIETEFENEDHAVFNRPLRAPAPTVTTWIRGQSAELIHVVHSGCHVSFRGWIHKDWAEESGGALLGSFRVAAPEHAAGTLLLVGMAYDAAYRVVVGDGVSTFEEVDEDLTRSAEVSEVLEYPFDTAKNDW